MRVNLRAKTTIWASGMGTLAVALVSPITGARVSGQAVVRRDSAGVQIVSHRISGNVPILAVNPTPTARLGGTRDDPSEEMIAGDLQIFIVRDARGFVVADNERIFRSDARGKVIQTIARRGDGPGEFRALSGLCLIAGDTLIALDRMHLRASLFDPAGRYVRAVTLPGLSRREACLADGRIITEAGVPKTGAEMGHRAPYVLVDSRTSASSPLGRLPVSYTGLYSRMASVVAQGARIYVGDGAQMGYNILNSSGKVLMSVRSNVVGAPVPAGETERRLKSAVPAGQSADINGRIKAFLLREPPPKRFDPLRRILVAPDGVVWANETDAEGIASTWLVFGPDGALRGRVVAPRPASSTRQVIIAVGVGELFVQYLDKEGSLAIEVYSAGALP